MMKDSKNKENARAGFSMKAELAALERKKRGHTRKSMSPEQRRDILDQLFFEGEAHIPYVKQLYLLLALSALIATLGLVSANTFELCFKFSVTFSLSRFHDYFSFFSVFNFF